MQLPVKIVVFNNGVLGFVELEMKAAGFVETGVSLENPDFAAMARGHRHSRRYASRIPASSRAPEGGVGP